MPVTLARTALALALAVGLTAAACGDADDAGPAADQTTTAPSGDASGVEVSGAWARASAAGQLRGAAYFTVTSPTDDAIVAASVPAGIAGAVELHETTMHGEGTHGEMDGGEGMHGGMDGGGEGMHGDRMDGEGTHSGGMDGSMSMRQVERIELPAGQPVELRPGGLHVMLLDLPEPLVDGESFTLTLSLASGGEVEVEVEVRDQAP
jgi:periplasmic copper chaperone A